MSQKLKQNTTLFPGTEIIDVGVCCLEVYAALPINM